MGSRYPGARLTCWPVCGSVMVHCSRRFCTAANSRSRLTSAVLAGVHSTLTMVSLGCSKVCCGRKPRRTCALERFISVAIGLRPLLGLGVERGAAGGERQLDGPRVADGGELHRLLHRPERR